MSAYITISMLHTFKLMDKKNKEIDNGITIDRQRCSQIKHIVISYLHLDLQIR